MRALHKISRAVALSHAQRMHLLANHGLRQFASLMLQLRLSSVLVFDLDTCTFTIHSFNSYPIVLRTSTGIRA
jgi:hypothetical protein